MKKLIFFSLGLSIILGASFSLGSLALCPTITISEDVPMLCPKCGKYHKPTSPCE